MGLILLGAVIGSLFTLIIFAIMGTHLSKKYDNETDLKDTISDIELMGSVKYRFSKVTEITERQLELVSRTERPSASAAHSRHKNSIVGELKSLEQEKIEIFRSILKDGIDPKLQIVIDGKPSTMKMSEAVELFDSNNGGGSSNQHVPQTESSTLRNNGLRLVQTQENQDESGTTEVP
jgi:hypothetical protein